VPRIVLFTADSTKTVLHVLQVKSLETDNDNIVLRCDMNRHL